MVDVKSLDEKQEEATLTRLVSSDGLAAAEVEMWQLNRFDLNEPEESTDVPEALYRKIQAKIEPELKQQAELFKKEAYDASYKKGYEEGFLEGAEKGRVEAKELALQAHNEALSVKLTQLDALLLMFKQPYKQLESQVLSELTDLALHVAHEVTQKEVLCHKEWVLEAVQKAIKSLPDETETCSIELHPDDLELLNQLDDPMVTQWHLKANSSLNQGTCLVKQGNSSVLNSWKAQFDEVANQLSTRTPNSCPP